MKRLLLTTALLALISISFSFYAPETNAAEEIDRSYPSDLTNISGEWIFYVGKKREVYRVFLKKQNLIEYTTYAVTGYMLNPAGKKFVFSSGQFIHGNGSRAVFSFDLIEGESLWSFMYDRNRRGYWWTGSVAHVKTGKTQALFDAKKIK